jgi:hypothetical protein
MPDPLSSKLDDRGCLFATAEESVRFVTQYMAGVPFVRQLGTGALDGIKTFLDGSPVDAIFDRASRSKSAGNLSPWPRVRRGAHAGNESAAKIARQFRYDQIAIEARGFFQDPPFAAFLKEFRSAVKTAVDRVYVSLLILPPDFATDEEFFRHDTFFIHVRGGGLKIFPRGGILTSSEPGMLHFLPGTKRFNLTSSAESVVLRITLMPRSIAKALAISLEKHLAQQPGGQHPLRGCLSASGSIEALKIWRDRLPQEVSLITTEQIIEDLRTEEKPEEVESDRRGQDGQIAPRDFLYEGQDWDLPGLRRRDDDIYIVGYKGSGTTWMQMILFQLMTDGDLERIAHIYEYSPYPEFEIRHSGSIKRIEHLPSPRVLKSHLLFKEVYAPTGKFIYVARDGMEVAVSSYHHHINSGNGMVPFEIYFDRFMNDRPGWFDHIAEWASNRHRPNLLFLSYRELCDDLASVINKIAQFCNIPLDRAKLATVLERCTFSYMKLHECKFDPNAGATWLRNLCDRGRAHVSASQQKTFGLKYRERLPHTGLCSL